MKHLARAQSVPDQLGGQERDQRTESIRLGAPKQLQHADRRERQAARAQHLPRRHSQDLLHPHMARLQDEPIEKEEPLENDRGDEKRPLPLRMVGQMPIA